MLNILNATHWQSRHWKTIIRGFSSDYHNPITRHDQDKEKDENSNMHSLSEYSTVVKSGVAFGHVRYVTEIRGK